MEAARMVPEQGPNGPQLGSVSTVSTPLYMLQPLPGPEPGSLLVPLQSNAPRCCGGSSDLVRSHQYDYAPTIKIVQSLVGA